MNEDLAHVASDAAREALRDWSPSDPNSIDRLAAAIGEAVAACIQRQAEIEARHTALVMETSCAAGALHVVEGR